MPRGRPVQPPRTALGAAMRSQRGALSGDEAAESLGMQRTTFYRIERGAQMPSIATAEVLGEWLGWSVGQVIDAARRPPS